ncbi:MAG TPA: replicative DNA helicase [Solirubrobacteraceae bacterium]|jgi:replicative DNA helicase
MSTPTRFQRPQQLKVAQSIAPPHNIDAEESVLGAILMSERPMYSLVIEEALRPEDFYRERHRVIFAAMLGLYERSEPIDAVTVTDALRAEGILEEAGGPEGVDLLAGAVPNVANLRHYAQIVHDTALLRRLLNATYEIQSSVLDQQEPARELVERAEKTVLELAHGDRTQDFRSIAALLGSELDALHELSVAGAAMSGTPTGFKDLDDKLGGLQPGNLIVIAARPSMGKSCLVTNIAENAAIKHGKPVALFSLEMSETELARRFIASQASIRGEDLSKGRVPEATWPKIIAASKKLAAAPLWIDDSGDIGMLEIRAKARRLYSQNPGGLGLVIVDYLQLLRAESRSENRAEIIGQMSRGLKMLARELDVPVIALSQLNRSVESRNPKIPLLSDLRESGAVEQDADVVVFIYRDDYYNPLDSANPSERPGEADLIVAKNRNGPVGKVTLTFRPEYPRFMSYTQEERFA